MNNKREVNFKVLYDLLKRRGPLSLLGIIFTALSIFICISLILIAPSIKKPYEKYNFSEIIKNGTQKTAKVTSIDPVYNVTVNGEHPEIISYDYENNGQSISDKFETFDLEKAADYKVGGEISVLAYQNQSMIKDLKPYGFPVFIFYLIPLIFFTIGLIFLLITLPPALKIYNLYKTGFVKEAQIISITSGSSISPIMMAGQSFEVNYSFLNEYGNIIFGASKTPDFLIVNEKKAGDPIKIFVSEMDENKSCLVPALEAMKYNWSI